MPLQAENVREELPKHTFTTKMRTKSGSKKLPMQRQHVRLKKSITQYQEIQSQILLNHQSQEDHQCHQCGSWKEVLNLNQGQWYLRWTISNLRLWVNGMQILIQDSLLKEEKVKLKMEQVVLIADLVKMVLDQNAWKITAAVLPRTKVLTILKFAILLLKTLTLEKMRSREPSSAALKDFS